MESHGQQEPQPLGKSIGRSDKGSKEKANMAKKRMEEQMATMDSEAWPRGVDGKPMVKITMTAAELIPTGQYANVSVGPAQITAFVDHQRVLDTEEPYFSQQERDTLASSLNELAEIVEADVIAVQRNLVLESLQTGE